MHIISLILKRMNLNREVTASCDLNRKFIPTRSLVLLLSKLHYYTVSHTYKITQAQWQFVPPVATIFISITIHAT